MATLNDINKQAKTGNITTFADGIPNGFFVGVTPVLGITTFYVFKGQNGDPEAPIVGRLESPIDNPSTAYRGDRFKGGEYLASNISFIEAVHLIVK